MRKVLMIVLALGMSACSGLEVGGKAWITRVDERQESQRTHRTNVPLRCYFVPCNVESDEAKGS